MKEERDGITRLDQKNPAYASMLCALDKTVGRLITKLKDEGLYEHATIIFTSDNGGLSTLDKKRKNPAPTSVLPLRGGKGWLYEGGIRVPLLIKPAGYADDANICELPVIGHDFYPTLLSLAGIKPMQPIDGVDISPLFDQGGSINKRDLFWHYPHYHGSAWTPGAAIRQGDWKLIEFYESETVELYNLTEDISETNNLSISYPEKTRELLKRLHELQEEVNAGMVSR